MKIEIPLIIFLFGCLVVSASGKEIGGGIKGTYFKCPEVFSEAMDPVFLLLDQRKYDQILNKAEEIKSLDKDLLNRDRLAWHYLEARALQETLDTEGALKVLEIYRTLASQLEDESCNLLFDYYINTARCHIYNGDVEAGIAYMDTAYLISDKGNPYDAYQLYRAEAYLFQQQGQYRAAIDQIQLAYDIAQRESQPIWAMDAIYCMAMSAAELQSYPEAIQYLSLGEAKADETHNLFQKWRFMACNGICHIQSDLYEAGVEYLQKAADLGVSIDRVLCCGNDAFLAKGLYLTGQKEKAIILAEKAWAIVSESAQTRDRRNVLHALLDIYTAEGQLEKALDVQSKLYSHREALHDRKYDQLVANLEVKYRARESALQLAEQSHQLKIEKNKNDQKRIILIITSCSLLILVLMVVILWRINKRKTQVASVLQEKNQVLNQIDKTKNQFFEDVSHEFRTPLSLIIGHLTELEDRIKSPANQEHLKTAIYNANRLTDMVNQLLELSKIQTAKITLKKEKVALKDWLSARIASFHSIARDRQAIFERSVHVDSEILALIDPDKMEKVINNLLHNACKYVVPGGRIAIEASLEIQTNTVLDKEHKQREMLVLLVSNTVRKDLPIAKDQLFERHYQKTYDDGQMQSGFGIGLALTKDFLQIMGGDIQWVDSEPGLFKLKAYVPVDVFFIKTDSKDTYQAESLKDDTDTARILVVEDQPETRSLIKSMLQTSYRIITAENVRTGLKVLRSQKIDLLITDIWMPELPGLGLVSEIRTSPTIFKNIPIIVLSGDVTDASRLGVLKAGADVFLPKPIHKQELLTHIESLLLKSRSRDSVDLLDGLKNEISAEQSQLEVVERLISHYLSDPSFSVGDIAAHMNVSERSLERLFKKTKGISPVAYLRAQRMHAAYHLLLEGRCSTVSEAREAVGIENASYFSRNFIKYYGFSPGTLLRKEKV